jgi:hypothetical protein
MILLFILFLVANFILIFLTQVCHDAPREAHISRSELNLAPSDEKHYSKLRVRDQLLNTRTTSLGVIR